MPVPVEEKDLESKSNARCIVCGASASGTVWDTDLCPEHYGRWFADPQFASNAIDEKIGMKKVRGQFTEWYPVHTPAQSAASAAEYRKRTAAWVEKQRAALARGAAPDTAIEHGRGG